ncbi:hypothetical protein CAAN1_01S06854 [[Candida] anglica]|uniref:Uncharacterized protein n=1 Tax=[Candida] anglica TaxID=148631 RepID=A0ABP0EP79_9ASCO
MAPQIPRPDLVVPYKHTPAKARSEASSIISQSLPMAAMFMRNKMLSWSAFFLAVQSYLNEPIHKQEEEASSGQQPPLLRVLFAIIALFSCYVDIFFPSAGAAGKKAVVDAAAAAATSS